MMDMPKTGTHPAHCVQMTKSNSAYAWKTCATYCLHLHGLCVATCPADAAAAVLRLDCFCLWAASFLQSQVRY